MLPIYIAIKQRNQKTITVTIQSKLQYTLLLNVNLRGQPERTEKCNSIIPYVQLNYYLIMLPIYTIIK